MSVLALKISFDFWYCLTNCLQSHSFIFSHETPKLQFDFLQGLHVVELELSVDDDLQVADELQEVLLE
jgi:hypothetical protein